MNWSVLSEDLNIPEWLRCSLPDKCKYCGKKMLAGRNEYGRYTGLKCEDDACISKIASQVEFIYDLLDIKGYGFANCLKLVREHGWSNPIQCLTVLKEKPRLPVGIFLRCCCIQGIDGEWVTLADKADAYTLEEMFDAYPDNEYLNDNKELLFKNLQYVDLTQRTVEKKKNVVSIVIMITGTPIGYPTKQAFIQACNNYCKGEYKIIHQETKRQSGVNFLIREEGSTTRGKVEAAIKGGIPILTSKEFIQVLSVLMKEVNSDDN